jgi:hypothetical protein
VEVIPFEREDSTSLAYIRGFISVYQNAAAGLSDFLFRLLFKSSPAEQVLLYSLIRPASLPEWVQEHPVFTGLQTEEGINGVVFAEIEKEFKDGAGFYQALAFSAGIESPRGISKAYTVLQKLSDAGVSMPPVSEADIESIFGEIGMLEMRKRATSQVLGMVRSLLSNREGILKKNREAEARNAELRDAYPDFIVPFEVYAENTRRWVQACRVLKEQREELRTTVKDYQDVRTLMQEAIRCSPNLAPLAPIGDRHPSTDELIQTHSKAYKKFLGDVGRVSLGAPPEIDLFRSLVSKTHAKEISKEPALARFIIFNGNATLGTFKDEAELREFADDKTKYGRKTIHSGWIRICESKERRFKDLVALVNGPLREFCRNMRPARVPELSDQPKIWPLVENKLSMCGYEIADDLEGKNRNEVVIRWKVPKHKSPITGEMEKPRALTLRLRGNLPLARAKDVERVVVGNGIGTLPLEKEIRHQGVSTLLKNQAVRMMYEGNRCFGYVSTAHVTEPSVGKAETRPEWENLVPGDRFAVIHLTPGGARLASVGIYEKTENGDVKRCPFKVEVTRTDSDRIFTDGAGVKRSRNRGSKTVLYRNFDLNSLDLIYQDMADDAEESGGSNMKANQAAMSRIGPHRANAAKTFLRQVAAEIANICLGAKAHFAVFAGGGLITSRTRQLFPVRDFATIQANGPRRQITGYLHEGLLKRGIRVKWISAKNATLVPLKEGGFIRGVPVVVGKDEFQIRGKFNRLLDPSGGRFLNFTETALRNLAWTVANPKVGEKAPEEPEIPGYSGSLPAAVREKSVKEFCIEKGIR